MIDPDESTHPLSITQLLISWKAGDQEAHDRLVEGVYPDLEQIARRHLRNERARPLCTGELVHEAYMKLLDAKQVDWERRAQFFGIASKLMRRILVDQARARNVRDRKSVLLQEPEAAPDAGSLDVMDIDAALRKMEDEGHEIEAAVVQLRFFAGLSIEETAAELGVSHATVERAWAKARTWLGGALGAKP